MYFWLQLVQQILTSHMCIIHSCVKRFSLFRVHSGVEGNVRFLLWCSGRRTERCSNKMFHWVSRVWDLNKMLHYHFLSLSLARSLFLLPSHSLFSSIKRPLPTHFFSLISFFSYAVFPLWILCSPLSLYGYYGDVQIGVIDQAERSSCIMQTD